MPGVEKNVAKPRTMPPAEGTSRRSTGSVSVSVRWAIAISASPAAASVAKIARQLNASSIRPPIDGAIIGAIASVASIVESRHAA